MRGADGSPSKHGGTRWQHSLLKLPSSVVGGKSPSNGRLQAITHLVCPLCRLPLKTCGRKRADTRLYSSQVALRDQERLNTVPKVTRTQQDQKQPRRFHRPSSRLSHLVSQLVSRLVLFLTGSLGQDGE